jgi:hypothetical protein
MNLGFIDPPYYDFTFDGVTYKYDTFKDATRNYCTDGKDSCSKGWVPGATVIHEFCHAVGMLHEHQNNLFNSNTIKLNKSAVIRYYNSVGMTSQDAQTNTISRYTCKASGAKDSSESEVSDCDYVGSKYDPDSIMLYSLPDDWVIGKNPTKPNFVLSSTDKSWLRKMYPIENKNMPKITCKFLDGPKWKQAWVQKMVIEQLVPLIGIRMRFVNSDGNVVTIGPIEYPSLPIATIDQPYSDPQGDPARCLKTCTLRCPKNSETCTETCTISCPKKVEHFDFDTTKKKDISIFLIIVLIVLLILLLAK